jgi:hypothetical protein
MAQPVIIPSLKPSGIGIAACALAALCAACVPDIEDDTALIEKPRVLAIRSTPAEARPEGRVELEALVAGGAGAKVDWFECRRRKPLKELGPVAPECLEATEARRGMGQGAFAKLTLDPEVCQRFGPIRPDPEPGEPAGRPMDPDPSGGFYQPVVVSLAADVTLGAVRLTCGLVGLTPKELIAYNEGYRPNENPEFSSIEFKLKGSFTELEATQAPTIPRGSELRLRASWAECPTKSRCGDSICGAGEDPSTCARDCEAPRGCTGAEAYVSFDPERREVRARREGIKLAWFASAGTFQEPRTGRSESEADVNSTENTWRAPDTPGRVTLWLVLRDDRGGVGWLKREVEVRQ